MSVVDIQWKKIKYYKIFLMQFCDLYPYVKIGICSKNFIQYFFNFRIIYYYLEK